MTQAQTVAAEELGSLFSGDLDRLREADLRGASERLLDALESGTVRAATPDDDGNWTVHPWVKTGILSTFRVGGLQEFEAGALSYLDREVLPPRTFRRADGVRIVPGGSAVRRGSHLARGVVCMPPSYVNVGAYVGRDTMIDSHVLVGSCAQIGARVHLSAAVQIGGVLEPAGAMPVIVEDDAFVGGGCGIYEGCIVRAGAVLAPGVILSAATPVYDLVRGQRLHGEIPENAVVVPGSRPPSRIPEGFEGVSIYAAVIVKYRDGRTDAATELEQSLRLHAS